MTTELTPNILAHNGFIVDRSGDYIRDGVRLCSGHREFWYWENGSNDKIETVEDLQKLWMELKGRPIEIKTIDP